ncbi:MAG: LamG domain-containing protein, partial [Psychrosphaera sp.]|nr:LamG domain-containing protein [Psychrosphaera sp.]
MSTLSPSKEFPLNAVDQLSGLSITQDLEFGFCAQLKSGNKLSFGTAGTMGVATPAFTTSVWIKLEDLTCALTFAADRGWAVLAGGKLQLVGGDAVAGLIAGQWHYVTWCGDGSNNQLYLDGGLLQTVAAAQSPWLGKEQQLEYVVSKAEVLLAHQHFYGHVLTLSEIMLDRAARLPSAASSFTQYYPLDFKVSNIDKGAFASYPENNLFIVDSTSDELITQQLNISNASDQVIHFEPFAAQLPIETNHHFRLSLRNAVFTQPGVNPRITALNDDPDWQIVRATEADPQDGSWLIYMRCRKAMVLAANATVD